MNLSQLTSYEVLQHKYIDDIRSDGWVLRHKKSGARVLLLSNDDNNKVFHITFRTTPKDSTGVAHITEHCVLCGSREFPLKDPFVELVKGSLNTFLNAMTYPDKTMYPVASCNEQDFKNLMHVYMDAVFYPNTYRNENIFRQEGWHYELEEPDGEMTYNGVVYNEMKGAFSTAEDVLEREITSSLFPDTTYGVESGGDPVNIPDLTYEAFLDFHRTYYHPSNSYIYLYGNMDMEERLIWMDEAYLSKFDAIPVDSAIPLQAPFDEMRQIERTYPVSEDEPLEDATYLTYNAVIGTSLDVELSNAFAVLEFALVETPGAPLKQALLDAGIGNDIMGSYDSGIYQPVFSIIAKNANLSDKERFLTVVRETLKDLAENGIDRKALLAGLNLMEFKYREADYGSYPKGLIYGVDLFDSWLYDDSRAFDYLEQLDVYKTLREKLDSGYFEELIRTYILENPHATLLTAVPERGKTEREEERVASLLEQYKKSLTPEQITELIDRTAALRTFQETPDSEEDLQKLPMLDRSDIDRKADPLVNEERDWNGTKVVFHNLFTNGITYLDLLFGAADIADVPALGLLKAVLGMVDTAQFGYGDLNNEINANTGGISPGISVFPLICEENPGTSDFLVYFGVKIRALNEKIPFALDMVREILLSSSLENDRRLYEIIAKIDSRLSVSMSSAGHATAASRSMASHSPISAFQDAINGIAFYEYIHDLEQNFEARKEDVKARLYAMCRRLFTGSRMMISVTTDEIDLPQVQKAVEKFVKDLPGESKEADKESDGSDKEYAVKQSCGGSCARDEESLTGAGTGDLKAGNAAVSGTENLEAENTAASGNKSLTAGNAAVSGNNWKKQNEAFTTAGQVQYVARTGNFCKAGFSYTGTLRILKVILSYDYLWLNIRVKGGAYGCMSSFGRTGDSYFVSYRDPKLRATNEVYDGIPEYLRSFDVSDRDMTKYIIGTISDTDVPRTPQAEGSRSLGAWMSGITDEMVQKVRDEILDATQEDIRALAPLVQSILDQQYICVIGSEGKVKEDSDLFDVIRPLAG